MYAIRSYYESFMSTDCIFPKVAIMDPELTVSVPKDQTMYGVV